MTDRVNGFLVVLDKDMRSDDVVDVMNALMMVKGVVSVTPNVADIESHIAYARARVEITSAVYKAIQDTKG